MIPGDHRLPVSAMRFADFLVSVVFPRAGERG